MNSHDYHSPYERLPYGSLRPFQQKPPTQEVTLHSCEVLIERKNFVFLLKENPRGRFLRIIEQSGSRPSVSVIVPSDGLKEFQKILADMVNAGEEITPKSNDHPLA